MSSTSKLFIPLALLLGLVLSSPALFAQSSDNPFVTIRSNTIAEIDFDAVSPIVRSFDDEGSLFQGLLVRGDGFFIVADPNQGGRLRILDGAGAAASIIDTIVAGNLDIPTIPAVTAVAEDSNGNLFLVNDSADDPDWVLRVPRQGTCPPGISASPPSGCLQGGYDANNVAFLDEVVAGVVRLADVKTVRFNAEEFFALGKRLEFDDVAVLVASPSRLLRYTDGACVDTGGAGGACTPDVVTDDFDGLEPTGLAFAPDGTPIITTAQGEILRFFYVPDTDPNFPALKLVRDGGVRSPIATLPGKAVRIAVGVQNDLLGNPVSRAFVTAQPQDVFRFDLDTELVDGLTVPSFTQTGFVDAGNPTTGVSPAAGDAVPVVEGDLIEVAVANFRAKFEDVEEQGLFTLVCTSFEDPRNGAQVGVILCDPSDFANCPIIPEPDDKTVPEIGFPRRIPSFIRAPVSAATEKPTFRFCAASTTVDFNGILEMLTQPFLDAEFPVTCDDKARIFWGPGPDVFETIIEDTSPPLDGEPRPFIDVTIECQNPRRSASEDSGFLPVVLDDVRTQDDIEFFKSENLSLALDDFHSKDLICGVGDLWCPDPQTFNSLRTLLDDALAQKNNKRVVAKLAEFESAVKAAAFQGNIDDSAKNVSGELRARTKSLIFTDCQAIKGKKLPSACNTALQ